MSRDEELISEWNKEYHNKEVQSISLDLIELVSFVRLRTKLSTLEEIEKRLETMKCFADGILSWTSWKYTKAKTKEEFQAAGNQVFFKQKDLLEVIEELKQRGT